MKPAGLLVSLALILCAPGGRSQTVTQSVQADLQAPTTNTDYTVVSRDAHSSVWQKVTVDDSGVTAEVALSLTGVRRVDTIEIEPAVVEAGHGFFPRVRRPFEDPRSHIHIEDARTYFARHQQRYDLILSEPSNPWVNGVASLFSTEFYRDVKRYLNEDGLFVQWIQLYELDPEDLRMILSEVQRKFPEVSVWITDSDLILIATRSPQKLDMGRVARIARAQTYPSRPVHLIVPFAPAGASDIIARSIWGRIAPAARPI